MKNEGYRAVICQSFGMGGLPGGKDGAFASAMEKWLSSGRFILMMTQVPYEGSDMGVYEVGQTIKEKYSILEAYNMTLEAAVTKLMWVLGQTDDGEKVRELFYTSVQYDLIV
jgi:L-asparaginase